MTVAPSSVARRSCRRAFALRSAASLTLALSLATTTAAATSDGVYGRFDGDLDLGLAVGTEIATEPARAVLRGTAHYYGMAGLTFAYLEPLRADHPRGRTLVFGPDLRPLFLPRWSHGLARGPAFTDLALDSLSLGLSASFGTGEGGPLGRERGVELSLGGGLPLAGRLQGPWLEARGVLRWQDGSQAPSPPPIATGWLLLSWHTSLETALARAR